MKQLVVISGKGGTGKTTITASLAALAQNKVLCDCDVDAADLFLLLNPQVTEEEDISVSKSASIDREKCIQCGKCIQYCKFNAISNDFIIDGMKCEGCGVCSFICPVEAIIFEPRISGKLFSSETNYGPFYYARLKAGSGNSGKLVTEIRKRAWKKALQKKHQYIITDGSPGIGCPVIASISGVDLAIIVTEPTLSGKHDLNRILELTQHFKVNVIIIINKFDINERMAEDIEEYCKTQKIQYVFKIPYDKKVIQSLLSGIPLIEVMDNKVTDEIKKIWKLIEEKLLQ